MTYAFKAVDMRLSELLVGHAAKPVAESPIAHLCLDSRKVQPGDVFVALSGQTDDGSRYVEDAIANGAIAVLYDSSVALSIAGCESIAIDSLSEKLVVLAERRYPVSANMKVFAVTGTNGKTSCCDHYATLRAALGDVCGTIGTLGIGLNGEVSETGLTTPDVFSVHKALHSFQLDGANYASIEVSSHALAQGRVEGVSFSSAVFTNLSRDHLDYHGSLEEYGRQKSKLFESRDLQFAIVNGDDAFSEEICSAASGDCQLIRYSLQDNNADVYAKNIVLSKNGISAQVVTPWGRGELNAVQIGRFNLQNLLAVIAVLCAEGCDLTAVLEAIASLSGVAGRMQIVSSQGEPVVIVDYAHTPDALENAIRACREHCGGELIVVFGCGGDRDKGKRSLMGEVAGRWADRVVVTSDNPRTESPDAIIEDGMSGVSSCDGGSAVHIESDRQAAIDLAIAAANPSDCVLIAGKGHETYQLLNSGCIDFDDVVVAKAALDVFHQNGLQANSSTASRGLM